MEHPRGPWMYAFSTLHCMTVSLAFGGERLGAVWCAQKARELFDEAGLTPQDVKHVEGDLINTYHLCTRPQGASQECSKSRVARVRQRDILDLVEDQTPDVAYTAPQCTPFRPSCPSSSGSAPGRPCS
jgi:hypothetical protein